MKTWVWLAAALAAAGSGCMMGQKNPEAESAATSCADAWLKRVDAQEYDASWAQAAAIFRGAVERERWPSMVGAIRGSMGRVLSREVKSARYMTQLPGGPDGEYVVIQYRTVFENKKSAVETITPMKETNGEWRVSGYFIR
jgi:hypothetical protein